MSKEQEREALIRSYGDACFRSGQFPLNVALGEHRLAAYEALCAALASPAAEPVQALTEGEERELLDWVSACQSAYHIDSTPGHRFGDAGIDLHENRNGLVAYVNELLALRSSPPATKEAKAGWIPVSERLPESGVTVLACYTNRAGKSRRIRAQWVAAKSMESDSDSEIGEYDEATDTYYDPEGWYECIDNWDIYSSVTVTEGAITHWMPLPPAPEGAA